MYTKEDIEKAKQYLDNEGYGTGSNFTLNAVANLMAEYAAKQYLKKIGESLYTVNKEAKLHKHSTLVAML